MVSILDVASTVQRTREMKRHFTFALTVAAFMLVSAGGVGGSVVRADEPSSTSRYVHGIITTVDPDRMTIASMQNSVSGKLDPKRTRVTVNGKPGKLADLKLTAHAKAELCLDDVWIVIDAH